MIRIKQQDKEIKGCQLWVGEAMQTVNAIGKQASFISNTEALI